MRNSVSLLRHACVLAAALMLSACAGTNFVRPSADALTNGKTTEADVRKVYGSPFREGTTTKNEQLVKTLNYAYAAVGGAPLEAGVTPARGLEAHFFKDVLVGYVFLSSFAEDHTNFDENKRNLIVKGKTTRAEVVQLLGRPGGFYVYPMITQKQGDAAVYLYRTARGNAFNMKFASKQLLVSFDSAGVVTDVAFESSGQQ